MSPSRSASSTPESPESTSPAPAPTPPPATSSSSLFAPTPSPNPSSWETTDDPNPQHPAATPTWSTDAPADPSNGPGEPSDTPSTGSSLKVSKQGLRAAVGTGFRQACRMVAAFVAIDEERAAGVWEPDDEDVQDVARPATNIIYRRMPDEAKGGDAVDLIALGLALVGYVGKNLQRRARVRTVLTLQAQQGIDVPGEGATP